jgi:hypothetical protein
MMKTGVKDLGMSQIQFSYVYELSEEEDEEHILDVPKFPEIVVSVSREEVAIGEVSRIAEDAILNALQARIDYNDVIPPGDHIGPIYDAGNMSLSPLVQVKLLLYTEYLGRKTSKSEFSRSLGVSQTHVSRLFDLSHESRYDVVLSAFEKLGLAVETQVQLRSIG